MNKCNESKALVEVHEWKAACARDVEGLGIVEAVRKRLQDSAETSRKLGFLPTSQMWPDAPCVAETVEPYGTVSGGNCKGGGQ